MLKFRRQNIAYCIKSAYFRDNYRAKHQVFVVSADYEKLTFVDGGNMILYILHLHALVISMSQEQFWANGSVGEIETMF